MVRYCQNVKLPFTSWWTKILDARLRGGVIRKLPFGARKSCEGGLGFFCGTEAPRSHSSCTNLLLSSPLITGSKLISFGCYEEQTLWLSAEGQSLVFLSGY